MEANQSDLAGLGLSGYEAAAYLALLGRGGVTPTELSARAKVPRQRVYDVLESLAAKGLCAVRDTNPRTYFPVDPAKALDALSQQRALELQRERERTERQAQALIDRLGPLFQAGRAESDPLQYVEVLASPERIEARAFSLAQGAQRCVNSLIMRPLILSSDHNWRFLVVPLEKGLRYRALYERDALDDPELRPWMEELSARGQEIRIVPELPLKMQAFDDEVALLSMQDPVGGPPSFTALAIRHRGTVALLNLAFERLWDEGERFGG